jgi:predicted aconitase
MLHVRGHTPEGDLPPRPDARKQQITPADLAQLWGDFNSAAAEVDLVAIGSPHASLSECRRLADLLQGQRCHASTDCIVTVGRQVFAAAQTDGILARLQRAGVRVIPDLCWCSMTEPVFPRGAKVLMTNSGKYSHYAAGLTSCGVRFGSLADCARAAVSGQVSGELPSWL